MKTNCFQIHTNFIVIVDTMSLDLHIDLTHLTGVLVIVKVVVRPSCQTSLISTKSSKCLTAPMKSTPQRSLTLKRMAAWIIQLTVTKIKYLTISAIPILVRPCAKSLIADSDLLIRLFNLALWEFILADDFLTVLFFD